MSVVLAPVTRADTAELIQGNLDSREYHHPWTAPFTVEAGFDAWFGRTLCGPNVGLVAREAASGRIVGVVNLTEIVAGALQSAYLGYYGMADLAGHGLMTEAVRLAAANAFGVLGLHGRWQGLRPRVHTGAAAPWRDDRTSGGNSNGSPAPGEDASTEEQMERGGAGRAERAPFRAGSHAWRRHRNADCATVLRYNSVEANRSFSPCPAIVSERLVFGIDGGWPASAEGRPIDVRGVRQALELGWRASVGDPYDNAMAESFFSTLESELLSRRFASQAKAKMACFSYTES